MNTTNQSPLLDQPCHKDSIRSDLAQVSKGFAMGVCDSVPGVSGGTVALVVGIYDRLFTAISCFNKEWLHLIRQARFRDAFRHVDGRFVVSLVMGIALGYLIMSQVIKVLMADDITRSLTLASFLGMIIGSLWIVFRMIHSRTLIERVVCLVAMSGGVLLSSWIAWQNHAASSAELDLVYLFFCTVIAVCAMILPGISGAMILLILGVYYSILDIPGHLLKFEKVGTHLVEISVFGAGCVIGLLSFSRLIKWVLTRFRMPTLSAMMGMMLGSLVILWPFQNQIVGEKHHKPSYELYVPQFGLPVIGALVCAIVFATIVIVVDRLARGKKSS